MFRWLILFAAVFAFTVNIFAQQTDVWEGNATVVSEGVFEEKGLFAASNAFPENTIIQVENPRTGKMANVTVVKRIIDNPNLFLLLSGQAAELLEMEKGDVERVKIQIAAELINQIPSMLDESLITQDPDLNPAATPPSLAEASTPLEPEIKIEEEVEEVAAAEEAEAAEVEEAEEGEAAEAEVEEVEEATAAEKAEVEEASEEAASPEAASPEVSEEVPAGEAPEAQTEAEKLAERAAARTPQKDFFQPPKEAQEIVSPEVTTPDEEETEVAEAAEPPVEEPEVEDLSPGDQETEDAEVSISEEPKVQEKLLEEGPEPTLAPPSVEEPVLAFSEIKPQPPVHTGEEIPEPTVGPPAVEESITPFSAVSPESPLLTDTSDTIEIKSPETVVLDESLLYLVPPEYFIEDSLEMTQPETASEAGTLIAETSHEPSLPRAAEDEEEPELVEEVKPAEIDEPVVTESPAVVEAGKELAEEVKPAEIEAPVVTEGPAVAEAGKELVLEATEPKPPSSIEEEKAAAETTEAVAEEVEEPVAVEEPAAAEVVAAEPTEAEKPVTSGELTVKELPADYAENRTYFIQLAAYNSVELAKTLETNYSDKYPVAILAAKRAAGGLYRVLIGPLNEDETGTLLTWFQAKGFDDAFVRSAN